MTIEPGTVHLERVGGNPNRSSRAESRDDSATWPLPAWLGGLVPLNPASDCLPHVFTVTLQLGKRSRLRSRSTRGERREALGSAVNARVVFVLAANRPRTSGEDPHLNSVALYGLHSID